jgi:hypothetical protein
MSEDETSLLREDDDLARWEKEPSSKVYSAFLYIFFIEALIGCVFVIYEMAVQGVQLRGEGVGQNNVDAIHIIGLLLCVCSAFTFFIGIKARKSLDDKDQYRFAIFMKVLVELFGFLLVFFIIVYFAVNSDATIEEEVILINEGVHIVFFTLMYLKARGLSHLLDLKRKRDLVAGKFSTS